MNSATGVQQTVHAGWLGLAPVIIFNLSEPDMAIVSRSAWLDWWLDWNEAVANWLKDLLGWEGTPFIITAEYVDDDTDNS